MMEELKIGLVDIHKLKPMPKNAKAHPKSQIDILAKNFEKLGFYDPVIVANGVIISGEGRWRALKLAGSKKIPCIDISYMSELDQRGFALADNKIAEKSEWIDDVLQEQLHTFSEDELLTTGFKPGDLEKPLIDELEDIDIGDFEMGHVVLNYKDIVDYKLVVNAFNTIMAQNKLSSFSEAFGFLINKAWQK